MDFFLADGISCIGDSYAVEERDGMAYRIEYGTVNKPQKEPGRHPLRIPLLTALFFLVFVLFVNLAWPEGKAVLQDSFLPGNSKQSFAELITDLQEGEPLSDAVTAFCKSILEDGKIAD